MIAIPEMEGFLKLEELKELQGADVDKLLKLDEFNKLEVLKELGALEDIQELKQLENIDEEWAADLEAEIAAILKEVEALLREFAIHHSTD